jgi:uncharacterized SAM-binding protein YcdF (DUF218 family)
MDDGALRLAEIIWNYHQIGQEAVPGDVIVVFGTNDTRVAEFAAGLYRAGFGETLVITGGMAHQTDLLATGWTKPEAEVFADIIVSCGVPEDCIRLEPRALNTAENIRYTRALLADLDPPPRRLVLACKPFMQRRVWATLEVEWPEMPATVASPDMTLAEYFTSDLPPEKVIPVMMGDLQRIWIYGRRGWSAPQKVPDQVMDAYRGLVALGYTQHLLPDD